MEIASICLQIVRYPKITLAIVWLRVPVVLLFVTVAVLIFSHLHRAKHFLVVGSSKHFPLDDAGSACDFDIFLSESFS